MKCATIFSKLSTVDFLFPYLNFVNSSLCNPIESTLSSTTDVDLEYAIYRGTYNEEMNQTEFLGIRYAASPTDDLRFQAPKTPNSMRDEGILEANNFPPMCFQVFPGARPTTTPVDDSYMGGQSHMSSTIKTEISNETTNPSQSEDCLFLNVYVSGTLNPKEKMPVVIWIHGGGYLFGGGSTYPGGDLIKGAGGGIIAVVIQYRLGLFGFLAGNEVKKKGSLNAGLLDQRFALEWIQDNIHLFGGDPNKVTIWGETAGAGSVIQHMVAHGGHSSKKLFSNAITSSIFLPSQYNYDDPIPEKIYSDTIRLTGCGSTNNSFVCLTQVDALLLGAANLAINNAGFFGTVAFVPVVGGELIAEQPMKTIAKGFLNSERYLAVSNTFEGRLMVYPNLSSQMDTYTFVKHLFPSFSISQIQKTVRQYTNIGLNTVEEQAAAIIGESIFICPGYTILSVFHGKGYKGLYAVPPGNHGADIQHYFPGIDNSGVPPEINPFYNNTIFSTSFSGGFLGFVKFDDPNKHTLPESKLPEWEVYNEHKSKTEMLFNRTSDMHPDIRSIKTDSKLLKRCEFWKRVAPFVPH
ncbi:cephalosporin esterase [Pyrrhoderma noxium]|uniref:Cephalosporin esterase n=1 Tax=Pyrrhoderma noxium TaxID=2282107 RepID=A0A286UEK0_9AGAM|nr:cephalosporin esterase [Pyrrhoderma noxium]